MTSPMESPWSRAAVPDEPAALVELSADAGTALDHETLTRREQRLARWEHQIRQEEQRLSEWSAWLQRETPFTPAWSLPAQPVTNALRVLYHDRYFADDDIDTFAAGFGLDPSHTTRLLHGEIDELDIEHIAEVCEALKCSPYDLWAVDEARTILHAYGPERWPRYIEPLDVDDHVQMDDTFIRRRLDQQAGEVVLVRGEDRDPLGPSSPIELLVTCYREAGVLALNADGLIIPVEDTSQPAGEITEYHLAFRQVAPTARIAVPRTDHEPFAGPPPSHDAHPALAEIASGLRQEVGLETTMVRFSCPKSSSEQWLGLDGPTGAWQTWDDPRDNFPGDPSRVLDSFDDDCASARPTPIPGPIETKLDSLPDVEL